MTSLLKTRYRTLARLALGSLFGCLIFAQPRADLSKLVFVGDSLTAGFQNFSLLETQQVHGYAALIANQAHTPIILPLIVSPGVPNVLQLVSVGPPPVIAPAPGAPPAVPRRDPTAQPTDLAVPGMFLADLLNKRPDPAGTALVDGLTNLVLGFPSPFIVPGQPRSQVEQAIALKPTTVIAWAGNNDVLFPELFGSGIFPITPIGDFYKSFDQLLDQLATTHARLVVANVPDVTLIPYLTPVTKFAKSVNLPVGFVAATLGVQPGDSLRPSALPIAGAILAGATPGPLPALCPGPIPGFPQVPCVMTAAEIAQTRATVLAYNVIILFVALQHNATVVDIYSLINGIAAHGVDVAGKHLTLDFLGGIASLDGMHPTNTGYAIIANEFIKTMNRQLAAGIPPVSVDQVALTDPLLPH